MAWLRIDDRFRTHPKMHKAGLAGWLAFCGICYCREHLTDGIIPREAVQTLAPGLTTPYKHAAKLVEIGLWHQHSEGFEVHDFLDWNPSKTDVAAGRDWETQRKGLYRDKDLTKLVRQRDGDACRYCGRAVNWADRRGSGGGQHDHIVPRGPSTLENVVVACRECNRKKWDRTPEEAGMTLLPAPNQVAPRSDLDSGQKITGYPSRAHAGDAGLGSVSSGDLGSEVLEENQGETTNLGGRWTPVEQLPAIGGGLIDGRSMRTHAQHAWCSLPRSGLCVPAFLHEEFTGKLGATDANARLRAWYPTVIARYAGVGVGEDALRFWRNEFATWVGTATSSPVTTTTKVGRTLAAGRRLIAESLAQGGDS